MARIHAVYIVSLKFAPGLKKEFQLIGENIRKHGFDVAYLLADKYAALGEEMPGTVYIKTGKGVFGLMLETLQNVSFKNIFTLFSVKPPLFLLFYNPHPLNPLLAGKLKREFPDCKSALFLHDPYKQDKRVYGWAKYVFYQITEWIQALTLRKMDIVISPSVYSSHLLKKRFPWYTNLNVIAPLMIPDQVPQTAAPRKYFSIVGTAHNATGHDKFVSLVNYTVRRKKNIGFAIISSSNIHGFIRHVDEAALPYLKIINKKIISDPEISEIVSQSYAVLRLDADITQSGVIPVCYMNSTPVIAPNSPGFTQHIQHGINGYILPTAYSNDDLLKAMEFVRDNFEMLSSNARASYENIWSNKNWDESYAWLIDSLKASSVALSPKTKT
ncbi:MAG: hypothetical protein A2X35_08030 [Elusimicrobia bacterium GWA2_61_42]|nr:MAG: hypothetical protein A2X35_08030 [Elusimicrobia bacterium GWA2_61_42]